MASTAYIFLVVISTYHIVAGNNILNVLRSIAEEAVPAYNVQERKVAPAKPSLKQPVVIIIGDGLLDQAYHQKRARPVQPPHRPRSAVPRPKEDSSQQADVISRVLALLQGKPQVKHEPLVTRRPRIAHDPIYNLLKKESLRSPLLKSLLRQSNRFRCEKQDECELECKNDDRCRYECEEEYECEPSTQRPITTTEDYCDPCEDKEGSCGDGGNDCQMSTKGYTLEPSEKGCSRC